MRVADGLEEHLRPIGDVILLPGNPRRGDVSKIAESLARFGQLKPIVVDSDGVILAGNHTYQAARQLGWSEIAAVTASELEGAERTAFALADNRLSDLATYDDDALVAMIREVDEATGDLSGVGYDLDFVEELERDIAEAAAVPVSGDERYTPAWLFEAMGVTFDVDLAAPEGGVSWIPADSYYTKEDDALSKDWTGRFAWCNPPFSIASTFGRKWLEEVTDGVWLGPFSHATDYRIALMRQARLVWFPNELEFTQPTGQTEGIAFPVFLAGFGGEGEKALRQLTDNRPDSGLLFQAA